LPRLGACASFDFDCQIIQLEIIKIFQFPCASVVSAIQPIGQSSDIFMQSGHAISMDGKRRALHKFGTYLGLGL
jgi:hypothetical protein